MQNEHCKKVPGTNKSIFMFKKLSFIFLLCFTASLSIIAQNIWKAAINGKISEIEAELAKGTDINAKSPNGGYTPLLFAIGIGQAKAAEFLLSKGALPDIENNEGTTALMSAITQKKEKLLKLLIDYKADVNLADRNGLPIIYAVSFGDYDMIELLYNAGANIVVKDGNGIELAKLVTLRKDKKKVEKLFATPPVAKK
jgi:ankyrin repeat protein